MTFPIDQWSRAAFTKVEAAAGFTVRPAGKAKSLRMAQMIARAAGYRGGGILELTGALPEGKGLASSSADMVATARAVAAGLKIPLPASEIEALLRRVEPSDGVMYHNIVSFYHREVALREVLGSLPRIAVLGHDRGGQVDTIAFNRVPRKITRRQKSEYAALLDQLGTAVRARDVEHVASIATRSAQLWLHGVHRERFTSLQRVCADIDGLGLILAHSGTMLGILLSVSDPEIAAKRGYVQSALPGEVTTYHSLDTSATAGPAEASPVTAPVAVI